MTAAAQTIVVLPADAGPRAVSAAARRHPLSRWHAVPVAAWLAGLLTETRVRPWQVSTLGLALNVCAAAVLVAGPAWWWAALALVWGAWLCDRLDGALARRQGTASHYGAWLDAQLDELADVLLQGAVAWQLARSTEAAWPWTLFAALVAGKYLFVAGMRSEEALTAGERPANAPARPTLVARLYHLPGDADARVHLLLAAIATGWLAPELFLVAAYYHVRWLARGALVARRLAGRPS